MQQVALSVTIALLLLAVAVTAWPLLRRQFVRKSTVSILNQGRQIMLAGQQMALDGEADTNPNWNWPGDYQPALSTLEEYCTRLVTEDYLKIRDLENLLSAPGCVLSAALVEDPQTRRKVVWLRGRSALKVYTVRKSDPENTIFVATANYIYNAPLNPKSVPYGDKGFAVIRKAGDAAILRSEQATAGTDPSQFQKIVGRLPGGFEGRLGVESPSNLLRNPQDAPGQIQTGN